MHSPPITLHLLTFDISLLDDYGTYTTCRRRKKFEAESRIKKSLEKGVIKSAVVYKETILLQLSLF